MHASALISAHSRPISVTVEPDFHSGDYLTFRVARQEFAMDAARVRGILPVAELASTGGAESTHVPWLAGFASLRGRTFPVVDLRGKLGLPYASLGRRPCIVAVEAMTCEGPKLAGFIADSVSDVVTARTHDYRHGKLRIGRPRQVLNADLVLARNPVSL